MGDVGDYWRERDEYRERVRCSDCRGRGKVWDDYLKLSDGTDYAALADWSMGNT